MRVDPTYVTNLVQQLGGLTAQESKVSEEIASGLRITSLADDPTAVGQNVQLTTALNAVDTFQQTAGTTLSRMQAGDTALGSVVTQLTSAISLATQGNSGTLNASQLQGIAQQLGGIQSSVLALANSAYSGIYLFAGTSGNTQPFTQNTDGTVTYNGDSNTNTLTTSSGQSIATSVPGSQLFGSGTTNDVFTALNNLIAEFSSGNTSTASTTDLTTLTSALTNLNTQRSTLDSNMALLTGAQTYAQNQSASLQASQTTLLAPDTATLATQLAAAETQRSALMSTIAVVEKGSLFDDLQ